MTEESGPPDWEGAVRVVAFPQHLDASAAAGISERLRAALRDGAAVLVADLSATSWCDRAGLDALIRAYQLAAVSQAELRLVVTGAAVGRLVADAGLDMLVAVFGSIEAAVAAPGPDGDAHALPRHCRLACRRGPRRLAGPARQDWPCRTLRSCCS